MIALHIMMYGVISACLGVVAWEAFLSEDQRQHVRAGAKALLEECRRRMPPDSAQSPK